MQMHQKKARNKIDSAANKRLHYILFSTTVANGVVLLAGGGLRGNAVFSTISAWNGGSSEWYKNYPEAVYSNKPSRSAYRKVGAWSYPVRIINQYQQRQLVISSDLTSLLLARSWT